MSSVVLFTNSFPYGSGEAYLESELPYLSQAFDEVVICALGVRKGDKAAGTRPVGDNVRVLDAPFLRRFSYLLRAPGCFADANYRRELSALARARKLSPSRLVQLTVFVTRARHEARVMARSLGESARLESDHVVLYSYRFDYQPYVAMRLAELFPGCSVVARGHGYDLYEDRSASGYLPFRTLYARGLDAIFTVCQHGKDYVLGQYGSCHPKVRCAYLGTIDHGIGPVAPRTPTLNVESCSNMVERKRLDKIVDALATITDLPIRWVHYGEGELHDSISRRCENLPSNIRCELRGQVPNPQVLEEYGSKPFHLFMNVSEDEGLPVSIMEAMSFGIPCLATDVGGTSEIVHDAQNGFLLSRDCAAADIARAIRGVATLSHDEYKRLRKNARQTWERGFRADVNYPLFVRDLKSLPWDV